MIEDDCIVAISRRKYFCIVCIAKHTLGALRRLSQAGTKGVYRAAGCSRSRAIAVKPVAFAWPAYCSLPRQPDLHRTEVCHAGFFV